MFLNDGLFIISIVIAIITSIYFGVSLAIKIIDEGESIYKVWLGICVVVFILAILVLNNPPSWLVHTPNNNDNWEVTAVKVIPIKNINTPSIQFQKVVELKYIGSSNSAIDSKESFFDATVLGNITKTITVPISIQEASLIISYPSIE